MNTEISNNIIQLDNKIDDFIKTAILFYLDQLESTVVNEEYEKDLLINKENSLYGQLCVLNKASPRIKALFSISKELHKLPECTVCHKNDFTIDCSMVVCNNCHKEYYIRTSETLEYCKECVGYTMGTCEAKEYFDTKDKE